jgi:hypothetical protein
VDTGTFRAVGGSSPNIVGPANSDTYEDGR